jgi:hypothetical protein
MARFFHWIDTANGGHEDSAEIWNPSAQAGVGVNLEPQNVASSATTASLAPLHWDPCVPRQGAPLSSTTDLGLLTSTTDLGWSEEEGLKK